MNFWNINGLKRILIGLIVIFIVINSTFTCFATEEPKNYDFSGGEGTSRNPYLISNVEDLLNLSEAYTKDLGSRGAHFKLINDIDMGDNQWQPIGVGYNSFRGVFDGNWKKITLKNILEGENIGLFGTTSSESTVKNLTVKGLINKTINSNKAVNFGLIAGRAEGRIENCITEGIITLTIKAEHDISIGGAIGFGVGDFHNIKNSASINLSSGGGNYKSLGGVIGASRNNIKPISQTTNTGNIVGDIEGLVWVGGIVGDHNEGNNIHNILNQGDISITVKNLTDRDRVAIGGIAGCIMHENIDKALNTGNIKIKYIGNSSNAEVFASGIAGLSDNNKLSNVGNEGNIEVSGSKIIYATGIVGDDATIFNAYTVGNIYGSSNHENSELYVSGLVGSSSKIINFYNSGSVKLKSNNKKEVHGDSISNIRPGESPKTFKYGYWPNGVLPFPLLQNPDDTVVSFNLSNGKLSKNTIIGGKQYSFITDALNAWIMTQKEDYLKWIGQNTPTFDWKFGYKLPVVPILKNMRQGKWSNTSDWAYEWMDKADRFQIIPEILLDEDMTKEITRLEFSALAVKLYGSLSGKEVILDCNSPFKDTDDKYVAKAYNLGIVAGTGDDLFSPRAILTREQASTMMTRVYKKVFWDGWTSDEDIMPNQYSLNIDGVMKFSDDNMISSWAKESVYFMAKNNIVNGIGSNMFGPVYKAGEKESYGRATREQAFKIAVGMIEKFK